MHHTLTALLQHIGSGCLSPSEIERIAEEAMAAYQDPDAFLRANPDINYDDSFPIPLGEWLVVGNLPDTVLFQGDSYQDVFEQIRASFDASVPFVLTPKQLAKTPALTALNRIQVQMSSLYPEKGGYMLVDFSQPLDDALQVVLVYRCDLASVLEQCQQLNIHAVPSYEALKSLSE